MTSTFFTTVAFAACLFASASVFAGEDAPCHFHGNKPVTQAVVVQCATQYKDKLVAGGKLEKTWQAVAKVDKLEQIDGKRSKEWKLSYKNPAAADPTKGTLYLFYTLSGNFIAANHTGQ